MNEHKEKLKTLRMDEIFYRKQMESCQEQIKLLKEYIKENTMEIM